ncbi:hypothetical protein D3C81_841780 [compost metagenome]
MQGGQRACRLLQRAKMRSDTLQGGCAVDATGHDQHRVVGLVPGAIERLQIADRHVLDIGARADRHVGVVVPIKCHRTHALHQHAAGLVVVGFHLVADDGHFAVQVRLGDPRIDHAVRFQRQQPIQRFVVGRERAEVVGAIQRGGRVLAHTALLHLTGDVRVLRRALEQQVLQQMRHAGLAVVLMHRAHAVDQIDRHRRLACIREQQHPHSILQPVFADTFHARARDHRARQCRAFLPGMCCRNHGERKRQCQ